MRVRACGCVGACVDQVLVFRIGGSGEGHDKFETPFDKRGGGRALGKLSTQTRDKVPVHRSYLFRKVP